MKKFLKLLGARILSEANDLKRTPAALADDLGMSMEAVNKIIQGESTVEDAYNLIHKMGDIYPINPADCMIARDDCTFGIRIMTREDSQKTQRVFDRKDKMGEKKSYYEYRDTAMSRLSPFKPEWIKMLRVVDNNDPKNPDVAYNNGHFLHQTTFFIGPVNFYWEVDEKKYCEEMDTGDSNYITPFWPHSFATRDPTQEALIIAVTFGGDVSRAQRELYSLNDIEKYLLDMRNPNGARVQLIQQYMADEMMTPEILESRGNEMGLDVKNMLDESKEVSIGELEKMSEILHVNLSDLLISQYKPEEEVVVRHRKERDHYVYPNEANPKYKVRPLARASKMPLMKGFDIEVLTGASELLAANSLHTYVFNYGNTPAKMIWMYEEKRNEAVIGPEDSVYIQPGIKHAFSKAGEENPRLCIFSVPGAFNLSVQKEMSFFPEKMRLKETKVWFN